MIRRYTFGKPFPTEAVVKELPYETDALPFFSIEDNRLSLPLEMTSLYMDLENR
mgnify:CR=1 FL=1